MSSVSRYRLGTEVLVNPICKRVLSVCEGNNITLLSYMKKPSLKTGISDLQKSHRNESSSAVTIEWLQK